VIIGSDFEVFAFVPPEMREFNKHIVARPILIEMPKFRFLGKRMHDVIILGVR
jgi:hypothetical protein